MEQGLNHSTDAVDTQDTEVIPKSLFSSTQTTQNSQYLQSEKDPV